jgi:hypothetical protein
MKPLLAAFKAALLSLPAWMQVRGVSRSGSFTKICNGFVTELMAINRPNGFQIAPLRMPLR